MKDHVRCFNLGIGRLFPIAVDHDTVVAGKMPQEFGVRIGDDHVDCFAQFFKNALQGQCTSHGIPVGIRMVSNHDALRFFKFLCKIVESDFFHSLDL